MSDSIVIIPTYNEIENIEKTREGGRNERSVVG